MVQRHAHGSTGKRGLEVNNGASEPEVVHPLAVLLLRRGLVSELDLRAAQAQMHAQPGERLGTLLVRRGAISEEALLPLQAEAFGVELDISRALGRRVWLKSGGYIVIDQTEAMTVIDVNTGKFVGKEDLEDTILKTNLEAVKEIA